MTTEKLVEISNIIAEMKKQADNISSQLQIGSVQAKEDRDELSDEIRNLLEVVKIRSASIQGTQPFLQMPSAGIHTIPNSIANSSFYTPVRHQFAIQFRENELENTVIDTHPQLITTSVVSTHQQYSPHEPKPPPHVFHTPEPLQLPTIHQFCTSTNSAPHVFDRCSNTESVVKFIAPSFSVTNVSPHDNFIDSVFQSFDKICQENSYVMELPIFDGNDPREWIIKARNHFKFKSKVDADRIRLSGLRFEGRASTWYRWFYETKNEQVEWKKFLHDLLLRFDDYEVDLCYLINPLRIQQQCSVDAYATEFLRTKELAEYVYDFVFTEEMLVYNFISGLEEEIRECIEGCSPNTLQGAINLAKFHELQNKEYLLFEANEEEYEIYEGMKSMFKEKCAHSKTTCVEEAADLVIYKMEGDMSVDEVANRGAMILSSASRVMDNGKDRVQWVSDSVNAFVSGIKADKIETICNDQLVVATTISLHKLKKGVPPWGFLEELEKKTHKQLEDKVYASQRRYLSSLESNHVNPGVELPSHAIFLWASGSEFVKLLEKDHMPNKCILKDLRLHSTTAIPVSRSWKVLNIEQARDHTTFSSKWYKTFQTKLLIESGSTSAKPAADLLCSIEESEVEFITKNGSSDRIPTFRNLLNDKVQQKREPSSINWKHKYMSQLIVNESIDQDSETPPTQVATCACETLPINVDERIAAPVTLILTSLPAHFLSSRNERMKIYIRFDNLNQAMATLERMPNEEMESDVVIWNTLTDFPFRSRLHNNSKKLFEAMQESGSFPFTTVYNILVDLFEEEAETTAKSHVVAILGVGKAAKSIDGIIVTVDGYLGEAAGQKLMPPNSRNENFARLVDPIYSWKYDDDWKVTEGSINCLQYQHQTTGSHGFKLDEFKLCYAPSLPKVSAIKQMAIGWYWSAITLVFDPGDVMVAIRIHP